MGANPASLGLYSAIEPGFSEDEMQRIVFAAKMAALRCPSERRRRGTAGSVVRRRG